MTIDKFNKILQDLAIQPSREKIFELAATLIEWMGFEFAENDKPRLLSPKTQKLKENLFPVPGTVQPQLYRLTSDGQQIRIRFAVLKKLKKDFIRQLLDGDVGLSSYQASMRGIIMQHGRESYISPQPYFVHFITTPDYKQLYAIFNTGDQKRIISFRNRLTQTQFNKILPQWQNIAANTKPKMAELFWESLDLKELNKDFYKLIKEQFDTLIGIAKTQYSKAGEEDVKQFAVRLIGRYIFCWFLKEKEIIPNSLLSSLTIQKHNTNYFQTYLKQLFFKTLNEEVQSPERKFEFNNPLNVFYQNIPYLNGGLFEKHPEDYLFDHLDLNNWLIDFTKVLESFDFTVDESSSQYQHVAIDPEMLGRIFENLLASQNPETEKLANQRKVFGAFYTPREIVDYMVNESLRAHIESKILTPSIQEEEGEEDISIAREIAVSYKNSLFQNLEPQQKNLSFASGKQDVVIAKKQERLKDKIDKLFAPNCVDNPFDKSETIKVREALSSLSILDPACGSGAFPMGILLRLMELRQIVGHGHKSSYDLKAEILSRNIYGVDIMPMAIEIARLRAWLSLVLEANYKPTDRKNNFGIAALPNLDFKFVCANSLIDVPENKYVERMAENDLIQFEKLTKEYFSSYDYKKIQLKKEIIKCINSITEFHEIAINRYEQELNKRKNNKNGNKLKQMYANQKSYEMQRRQWQSYKNIFKNKTVEFFNTKYFFPAIKNGFDVVIGNPPYVEHKKLKNISSLLKNNYETYSGTTDLYVYFYEKGIKLLKKNGTLIFITSNKFIKTSYGKNLRKYFTKYCINKIIDFTEVHVFEALVASCIFSISKRNNKKEKLRVSFANNTMINFSNLEGFINQHSFSLPQKNLNEEIWQLENETNLALKQKIEKGSITLKNINTINIYRGVTTGYNPAFIIDFEKRNKLIKEDKKNKTIIKPLLQGRNIRKWIYVKTNYFLIFTRRGIKINDYPIIERELQKFRHQLEPGVGRKPGSYSWYEIQDNTTYYPEFEKEKIIWGLTSDKWTFAYDNENNYLPSNGYILTSSEISIKFLLALLNSNLMEYYFGFIGIMTAGGAFTLKQETVSNFPIKSISVQQQKHFINKVEEILADKQQNQDTTTIEKEIDVMVYKLYELTYQEVKVIDPDFWLSDEEYKNFK